MMKKIIFTISILYLYGCGLSFHTRTSLQPQITYYLDLSNHEDDLFHVTISTSNLTSENGIYNFAATAPGTYTILDFGRFVKTFHAFDNNDDEIPVEKISANKWKIKNPEALKRIKYDIEDTFDAEVTENKVMPMAGTGIEDNFVAFNTFGVVGYFEGLQSNPVRMKIAYKSNWTIGTALDVDKNGFYFAETYDRLADSPVLIGELTVAETVVNNINVSVYVYATDTVITAQKILSLADGALQSASSFIGYSPVPNYKFLFCLLDFAAYQRNGLTSSGALEHSYSSIYVQPATAKDLPELKNTMAHEFMHILTPLNLHSEVIHSYNFAVPTPSEHIWLYEGVTEWASLIMQLRSGLMNIEDFLNEISNMLTINSKFNKDMSLSRMSLDSYTSEGNSQFSNFYYRGALTAALLDVKLLELSHRTKGLREVFLQLLKEYGKNKPFSEKKFFDLFVEMTYPEIKPFINNYIRGSEPLPVEEYLEKLGFKYIAEKPSDDKRPTLGAAVGMDSNGEFRFVNVSDAAKKNGLRDNDILIKAFGQDINKENLQDIMNKSRTMNVGEKIDFLIKRGNEKIELAVALSQRMIYNVLEEMTSLTKEQKFLREQWLKNLELPEEYKVGYNSKLLELGS